MCHAHGLSVLCVPIPTLPSTSSLTLPALICIWRLLTEDLCVTTLYVPSLTLSSSTSSPLGPHKLPTLGLGLLLHVLVLHSYHFYPLLPMSMLSHIEPSQTAKMPTCGAVLLWPVPAPTPTPTRTRTRTKVVTLESIPAGLITHFHIMHGTKHRGRSKRACSE